MNTIEASVVKVLSKPYEKYGKWWVGVVVSAYGRESETEVMCNSAGEAAEVDIDYVVMI